MKLRYDSYKPSGIDWIGEIPSHWTVMPLKRQGIMNTGLTFTKADLVESGDAVISYGQIHSGLNDKVHVNADLIRYIPKSISKSSNSALVGKGDFIFADTSEDLEGCGNAVYVDTPNKVYAGYHTIVLKRNDENGKFLAYLFQTDAWRSQIRSQVSGVKVYSVTQTILASTSIIQPPIEEQEAIAEWLDAKCGEIDAAIAKVDLEIELIDELKQSEISRVVTRGLNPDVPLRPSGIDWIGDVPEHWTIAPIKYSFVLYAGATPKTENPEFWDGDINWITPADYKTDDHFVSSGRKNISKKGLTSCATEIVPSDSLIFSKRAPIGTVALAKQPLCTNQGCISCVPRVNCCSNYFYYLCRISTPEFEILGSGATFLEISASNFANFKMPLPPLAEQRKIADYLDRKCGEIDGLKEKLKRKRETLVELRQSLISEVVTGKRKVI